MVRYDWMIAFIKLTQTSNPALAVRKTLRSDLLHLHPSGVADVGRSDAFSKKLIH